MNLHQTVQQITPREPSPELLAAFGAINRPGEMHPDAQNALAFSLWMAAHQHGSAEPQGCYDLNDPNLTSL